MRKILSEREIEEKKKKRARLFAIFMAVILIASTIGYSFISSEKKNNQNIEKSKIKEIGGQWVYEENGEMFVFSNSIESVKNISVETTLKKKDFLGKKIYIDSANKAVTYELFINLRNLAERIQEACYGPCEKDLPEKDCSSDTLIIWKDSLSNKVYQNNTCIFIEGDIKTVDAFLYSILDIKDE